MRSFFLIQTPKPEVWCVSNWSKSVKIFIIYHNEREFDISAFPPVNMNNFPHTSEQTHTDVLNNNTMSNNQHNVETTIQFVAPVIISIKYSSV